MLLITVFFPTPFFFKVFFFRFYFYVYNCFTCMCLCAPCACLVPPDVSRGSQIPMTTTVTHNSAIPCGCRELDPAPPNHRALSSLSSQDLNL